jgi:hypothetical protein
MFREALGYGVDGIALIFTRNFPFVGNEPRVVESFRKRYGQDPFTLKLLFQIVPLKYLGAIPSAQVGCTPPDKP